MSATFIVKLTPVTGVISYRAGFNTITGVGAGSLFGGTECMVTRMEGNSSSSLSWGCFEGLQKKGLSNGGVL